MIVKDLPREERWAFLGWFAGGQIHVTQYASRPDDVFMGKFECEQVPFAEFWLQKLPGLGWMTATETERGIAKGMIGNPEFIRYRLGVTNAGWRAREQFYSEQESIA